MSKVSPNVYCCILYSETSTSVNSLLPASQTKCSDWVQEPKLTQLISHFRTPLPKPLLSYLPFVISPFMRIHDEGRDCPPIASFGPNEGIWPRMIFILDISKLRHEP